MQVKSKKVLSLIMILTIALSLVNIPVSAETVDEDAIGILINIKVRYEENTMEYGSERQEGDFVDYYLPGDKLTYIGTVTNCTDETFNMTSMTFTLMENKLSYVDKSNIPKSTVEIPAHSTYTVEVPVQVKDNATGIIGYISNFNNPVVSAYGTLCVYGRTASSSPAMPTLPQFIASKNKLLYPYPDLTLTKRDMGWESGQHKYSITIMPNKVMDFSQGATNGYIADGLELYALVPSGSFVKAELQDCFGNSYDLSKRFIVTTEDIGTKTIVKMKIIFYETLGYSPWVPRVVLSTRTSSEPLIYTYNPALSYRDGSPWSISSAQVAVDYGYDNEELDLTYIPANYPGRFALDVSSANRPKISSRPDSPTMSTTYYIPGEILMYTITYTHTSEQSGTCSKVTLSIPEDMNIVGDGISSDNDYVFERENCSWKLTSDKQIQKGETITFTVPVEVSDSKNDDVRYSTVNRGFPVGYDYRNAPDNINSGQAAMEISGTTLYASADLVPFDGMDAVTFVNISSALSNNAQNKGIYACGENVNVVAASGASLSFEIYENFPAVTKEASANVQHMEVDFPEWITIDSVTDNAASPNSAYSSYKIQNNTLKCDYDGSRVRSAPIQINAHVNEKVKVGDTFTFSPHITGRILAPTAVLAHMSGIGVKPQGATLIMSPSITGYNVTQTLDTEDKVMIGDTVQYTVHIDAEDTENGDLPVHFDVSLPDWLTYTGEYTIDGFELSSDFPSIDEENKTLHFSGKVLSEDGNAATITYTAVVNENAKHGDTYLNTAYVMTQQNLPSKHNYADLSSSQIALAAPSDKITVICPNCASGTVFEDTNKNGVQDHNEIGIANAKVSVIYHNEAGVSVTYSVTTDENGRYIAENIPSGNYTIIAEPPKYMNRDMVCTTGNSTVDIEITAATETITDFGFRRPIEVLSGYVWNDDNKDAVYDYGETYINGVNITFTDKHDLDTVYTVTTDNNGRYEIEIPIGEYKVETDTPVMNGRAGICSTDNQITSISILPDTSAEYNVGFYIKKGNISGYIWNDDNNNQTKDYNEYMLDGVDITLTDKLDMSKVYNAVTDENGEYSFTELPIGDYVLSIESPIIDGRSSECTTSNQISEITVSDSPAASIKTGFRVPTSFVHGYVWEDINVSTEYEEIDEHYLKGITVRLIDKLDGTHQYSTTTDENGSYSFEDICIGDYTLVFETPVLYNRESLCSTNNVNSDIKVVAETGTEVNAGFYVPMGVLEGYVWNDKNEDGELGDDEPMLDKVAVSISDNNGLIDVIELKTDSNGHYYVSRIPEGSYHITVTAPVIDDVYGVCSTKNDVTDITIVANNIQHLETGFYAPKGELIGTVWNDADENGIVDENETALSDFVITVTDSNNNKQQTLSSIDGTFSFTDLTVGEYTAAVTVPENADGSYRCTTGNEQINIVISDNNVAIYDIGYVFIPTPTIEPTVEPTIEPTAEPTIEPTIEPTVEPTIEPTVEPTIEPTVEPTIEPTAEPTIEPTIEPTLEPTIEPTIIPMGNIKGIVWKDANTDKEIGDTEARYKNADVKIINKLDETITFTAITDENGAFNIENVPFGEYHINVIPPLASYRCTTENENADIIVAGEYIHNVGFIVRYTSSGSSSRYNTPIQTLTKPTAEPTSESTVKPNGEQTGVTDIPELNKAEHYAYIIGYPEGDVRPEGSITRAEVATIFFRMLTDESRAEYWTQNNNYADVEMDAWYNNAVSTLTNAGIIKGDTDGIFRPNEPITRAEFAAIASRFDSSVYDGENLFNDIQEHWAANSINRAANRGWVHGYEDDTFRPDQLITRAEAMTLVNNVLERHVSINDMTDDMVVWSDNVPGAWYYEAVQEATNSHDYIYNEDVEQWTGIRENRDWVQLEKETSDAASAGSGQSIYKN